MIFLKNTAAAVKAPVRSSPSRLPLVFIQLPHFRKNFSAKRGPICAVGQSGGPAAEWPSTISRKRLDAACRQTKEKPGEEGGGVMKDLKARDVMVRPVVAARKNAPVRDVVFQFLNGFYSGMPVTDDAGSVIGVVTELDILEAVLAGKELVKTTAGDIMTAKPITADVETPLTEVVKIMKEKNIIRLPVTEEGKLVGIVARCDILTTLIEPEFVTYM
jgi:CBS domain-containing protein